MKHLIAAMLIGLTSSLAAPVAPPALIKLETPFTLKVGASAKLVNWSVTFVEKYQDPAYPSCEPPNCPPWDTIIELRVTRDRASRKVILRTYQRGRQSAIALRQRVTLVGLNAEVATFKVSKP